MRRDVHSPSVAKKERIRAEIENQIQQFLQKGGRINVIGPGVSRDQHHLGVIGQTLKVEIERSAESGLA